MKFTRNVFYRLALCIVIIIIGTLSYNLPICRNNETPNLNNFIDSQLTERTRIVNISERTSALHAKQKDLIYTDNDAEETVFKSKVSGKYKLTSRSEGSNNGINWTVLVTVNNGYWDFFLNWFRSYRNMNIKFPIIAIAEDDVVYMKLKTFYSDIIHIENSEFTAAEQVLGYGSNSYRELVSRRPTHLLKYITRGIDILYVDIDAVWLQNPFPYFKGNFDMWMQLDDVVGKELVYCTGLIAFRSNDATIQLIRNWEKSMQVHADLDQEAFNRVIGNSSVRLSVLDTAEFPSGRQYFEQYTDVQRSNAVVVHNNWIIGHDKKLTRFQNVNLWFVQTGSDCVHLPKTVCIFAMSCVVVCAIVSYVIIIKRHLGQGMTKPTWCRV